MKTKRLMMCLLLSMALAVTFIPNVVFAAPEDGEEAQGTVTLETEAETVQPDVDLAEPDELLQTYLDQLVKGEAAEVPASGKQKLKKAPRKTVLGETDQRVYDILKAAIEEIAAGERTSTVIEVPMSEVFTEEGALEPKTEEDLGVPIKIDGAINPDARDAFFALYSVDYASINKALLTDLPYDLYWYDKSRQGAVTFSTGYYSYSNTEIGWADGAEQCMTFSFKVSREYSASDADDTYEINAELPQRVVSAASKINEVLAENAEESDLNKLTNYKEAICDLTGYNEEAAADSENYPTNDPWQLIWVFDEDDTTKVVCEGYSKAFQYLCDRTGFTDEAIESHLMTGQMYGDEGTEGAGPHMWNVVQMDDEKNYLVDVTNCDDGTIGDGANENLPDWLFLRGYSQHDSSDTYVFKCDNNPESDQNTITFVYGDDTLALYAAEELELSETDYDPEAAQEAKDQKAFDNASQLLEDVAAVDTINDENYEEVKKLIETAEAAFEALNEEQKGQLIEQYAILQALRSELQDFEANYAVVQNVINLIDELSAISTPEDIDDDAAAAIKAARDAYDELDEDQRESVTNYEILANAETQLRIAGSEEIKLDAKKTVEIENPGDEAYFKFTPEHDGKYIFSSEGEGDTVTTVYDPSGEEIKDDDSGSENNFLIVFDAKAGETWILSCSFYNTNETVGTFTVSLTESNIKEISYSFSETNTLIEGIGGMKETRWEDDTEYFLYNNPSYGRGDVLTVVDASGNEEVYTCQDIEDGGRMFACNSDETKMIDPELLDFSSNQDETPWSIGDENEVIITYMGVTTTANITIAPNPVTTIEFKRDGKSAVNLVKGRDGKLEQEEDDEGTNWEYFKYDLNFMDGDTLTIRKSDGSSETYTWLSREDGFYLPGHPVIEEEDIRIDSDQSGDAQWTDQNQTYQFKLTYYGRECAIDATLVDNPIQAIEYTGSSINLTEGIDARWIGESEDDPDGYYRYSMYTSDLGFTSSDKLTLTGNDALEGEYVYNEKEEGFVRDGKIIYPSDFEFVDTQDERHWILGTDNQSTWSYEGIEFTIPVTIAENEVESIQFTPADATYCIFEEEGQDSSIDQAVSELAWTYGHKLTITKNGTDTVYEYKEVPDSESDVYEGFVSEDGDRIDFDNIRFTAADDTWTADSGAQITATYQGRTSEFSLPVRPSLTRMTYVPASPYEVYEGIGEAEEDGFYYEISTERAGDKLYLYDSNEENAEPAFVFTCSRGSYGEPVWETSGGVKLNRIGYFNVWKNQPWEGEPGSWAMEANLNIGGYETDQYISCDIPVTYKDTVPVTSVTYKQKGPELPKLYEGIDRDIKESNFSGYSAITEGDTVTVTRTMGGEDTTSTYQATFNEEEDEWQFINTADNTDLLDRTYVQIGADQEDPWLTGVHAFTFSYYGVSEDADGNPAEIKVEICPNPISKVVFTPENDVIWDADTAKYDEVIDEDGIAHTIFRIYYEDSGIAAVRDGDTLTVTWNGEERVYTYDAGWERFRDSEGRMSQIPWTYEDGQEDGEYWKVGENQAYIVFGGVQSEPFKVTIQCNHRFASHIDQEDATCAKAGHAEYWQCLTCGALFADENCQHTIDKPEMIDPLEHTWGDWKPVEDTDQHQRTCSVCGNEETAGHTWDEGTVTKPATETETGIKTFTCTECNATKEEAIPPIGHTHDMEAHAAKEATCTEDGNDAYWYCSKCKKYFSDAEGKNEIDKDSWIIAATGHGNMEAHASKNATCTEAGNSAYWYCSKCKKYFSDAEGKNEIQKDSWVIMATGHSWGEWTKLNDQQHQRVCGHDSNHVETADHSWDEGKITKEATEDETGLKTWTCTVCNATKTETIDKLSHTHVMQHTPAVEPTNIKNGNYEYWYCSKCKKYFKDEEGSQEYADKEWFREATGGSEAVTAAAEADTTIQNAAKVNANDYSEASYKAVTDARAALKEVLDNPNATADQIKTATQNLQTAIDNLVTKEAQGRADAATTAGTAIQNAAKVNKGAYSAASYKAVESAVKALKTVLDNPNATADEIKAATEKLNKAIKALKKKQILKVKKKTIKVKLKKVKKKAQTVKPLTVTGQKGKLTYKGKPVGKKAKKALKINKKTGKITVRKKTKKGTYKMKVTVTAAGTAAYAPGSKTVTVTIKVR